MKPKYHLLSLLAVAAITANSAFSQTAHNWSGASSSDPTVAGNWSAGGVPGFGGTVDGRININNTASQNTLIYSAAQGHSIFTGQSNRALGSGSNSGGSISITGGILELRGTASSFLGFNGAASGNHTMSVDGGEVRAANSTGTGFQTFVLGFTNTNNAFLNINSGLMTTGGISFGGVGTASASTLGTVNLNGGTLTTNAFTRQGSATGTVNFNGGTLRVGAASTSYMPSAFVTANVLSGGARIDTNGFDVTIQAPLSGSVGDGGLTKQGAGNLTLSGANTYTGNTLINAGSLILASTASINDSSLISVGSGATFDVSAVSGYNVGIDQVIGGTGTVIGNTTIAGRLSPGNSPGTLTFDNNLSIATAGVYFFEGGDLTIVNGTLNLANDWILALGGGLQDGGSITLFSYDTAGSIDLNPIFDLTSLGFSPSGSLTLTDTGSQIILNGVSYIPEPSTALLGGLGMLFLLRRRR